MPAHRGFPQVSGNSVRATGGMNAAKTVYQDENEFGQAAGVEKMLATAADKYADNATITALAKTVSEQWAAYQANPTGYFDSVELMELDTMVGGKGINDPALVKTLCEGTADAIDWLDANGMSLHNVSSFGGASVKRIHRPTNAAGAQGQGIAMATAIGAGTVDMDQIQIHPTVEANTAALITEGLRGDGTILVNANGERFIDEVGTRDVVSAAEIAQPGSFSWLIVDQAMADASSVIQGYIKKGYTKSGATYEELAKELEIDPAAFAKTMET